MSKDLFKKITPKNITTYQKRLADELKLSPATVKRRLSSIRKFCEWAQKQGYLETNPFLKETEIPGEFIPQTLTARNNVFQKAYRAYTQASITKYFHYAVLIVFCAAIGFGVYDQFFKRTPTPLAYPESLTAPNRFLSFQGRLTDSSDNPISTATDITFKLWNVLSGGDEGTCTGGAGEECLWTSGTCSVSPDQDGIFSLLLGTTSGDNYTCSTAIEIPANVFTENTDLWLAITVDADGEMDPRMQIATVGYALNAETLQGFPPGTEASMIPYIDSTGKIVLAAASPSIQATSGTFALEGQTGITIQVADGQDGNITLSPKGTGTVNLTSEATTGNLLSNQGGVNFGTEGGKEDNNLYYGYVGLDTTNFNLLKLESGETATPKFTVDAEGNASASGILKALTTGSYFTGDITVSGGDITGANSVVLDIGEASADYITSSVGLAVGGAQTYYINTGTSNLNALVLAGDLTVDTSDFFVDVSENKIGIGTTTLTERLTLAGNATISGTLALAPNVQFDAGVCDAAAAGKMYYDGDDDVYYFCNGTEWTEMGAGGSGGDSWWTENLGLLYPVNETLDLAVGGTASASANVKLGASSNSDSFIYGGSLGIGTRNPGATLEVVGTTLLGGGLTGSEDALYVNTGAGFSGNLLKLAVDSTQKIAIDSTGMLTTASGVFTSTVADAADAFGFKLITPEYTTSGAKLFSVFNNTNERFSIDKDGVGTFYGDGSGSLIDNTSGDITINSAGGNIDLSDDNLINVNSVGINRTVPSAELDVDGDATISGTLSLGPNVQIDAGTCDITAAGKMYYDGDENKYYYCNGTSWNIISDLTGSGTANYIPKWSDSVTLTDSILYETGGNIGIGTDDPSAKLDIVGDLEVNGYATVSSSLAVGYTNAPAGPGNAIFSGDVGIGTDSPSEKLEIVGNLLASGTSTLGSGLTGSEDALYVNTGAAFSGNLLKLAVNGTQKIAIDSTGMLTTASGIFTSTVADAADAIGFKLITPAYTTPGAKLLSVWNNTDEKMSLDKDGVLALYNSESMIYNSSGDITIDAASGNVSFATNDLINIDDLTMGGTASISGTPNLTLIPTTNLAKIYLLNGGDLGFYTSVGGDAGVGEVIRITNSGNVGIGTTDPELYKLYVAGNVSFNSGGIYSDDDNFFHASRFVDSANADYFVDPAAAGTSAVFKTNVGIGTTSPSTNLDVVGNATISGTLSLGPNVQVDAGACDAAAAGKMYYDGDENTYYYCDGSSWTTMGGGETAGLIAAFTGSCPSGWTEYTAARGRTIVGTPSGGTGEGTVGTALADLGTRTITDVPSHTHQFKHRYDNGGSELAITAYANALYTWASGPIETTGSASVDVTMPYIQLTYCQKDAGADLAEWIPTSEDISKETIVSVDPNNKEKVIASRKAYDPTVVGIIATQPGWLIGNETDNSVQMALAGRVPTRISLINGEIKPGDPITTSPIPGVGMKATKSGPIVGKAMEALNESSSLNNCLNPETGRNEKCGTTLVFVNISFYNPNENNLSQDTLLSKASNEYYELLRINDDLSEGDLISLQFYEAPNEKNPSQIETVSEIVKAKKSSSEPFVGVISKEINGEGDLLRRERINNQIVSETRLIYGRNAKVKISPSSNPIQAGDPLIISDEEGMAEKAIHYGPTIGKALESWVPESGKTLIHALIISGWHDPDIYLTSIGEININHDELSGEYQLKNKNTGNLVKKISAFMELIAANIRAGRIETQEIISPVAEIEEIKTQRINLAEITSSSENGDIVINLENQNSTDSAFGNLIIKGQEGQEVASIDASGNASFSGELSAETLQIEKDATVAGTLYADEIITKHGKFGDLLVNEIAKTETPIESMDESLINEATDSAILSEEEINNLINEILASVPEATSPAELLEDINIPNDLLIANSLNIGGTLSLADNAVNTLSDPLYLQSLGLGGIDILAGKIIIDEHGNAIFEGDVTIKGRLAAKTISPLPENDLVIDLAQIPVTNELELPDQATQSAFGNLLIKGYEGKTVASIDASGKAFFASLGIEADYTATGAGVILAAADNYQENGEYSPAIKTNATAGVGLLPANESEIMIYNPKITDQSLIYITPLTDTENKVIYVKSKKAEGDIKWFKVAIDTPIDKEIQFNWWIVN